MNSSQQRWIRVALLNLMIVALIGVILRYKIAFYLPYIQQKHLLHGHSHFAFAGWITQVLMTLLVGYLHIKKDETAFSRYKWLLYANLLTAYGMLIAFPIEGYGPVSIVISTLSVFVSYVFGVKYWKDLNKRMIKDTAARWFKAAVLFNALSSLGAFALAFMMVNHISNQNAYLAAEYFYLHFQYNGWFFFGCMGLLTANLLHSGIPDAKLKEIFRLFTWSLVPAYLLSTLWMKLPVWIYIIVIAAAIMQVLALVQLIRLLKNKSREIMTQAPGISKNILLLSAIALTVKLLLQLGSVIPSLSDLAFGFRPIVIGYLHLVLLGVISLFLIGYIFAEKLIALTVIVKTGLIIFTGGIVLNEILLMTQGVSALSYILVPAINEMLFGAALIMFSGLLCINFPSKRKIMYDQD